MNKSFIYSISLLLILLSYSCDETVPPLSAEEEKLSNRAELVLKMDEAKSEVTVSVNKFATVSFIQFSIIYNYNKLSVSGYDKPHSSLQWSNLDDPNQNHEKLEFIFSGPINFFGFVSHIKSTPSSSALFTSLDEPGIFSLFLL